MLYMNDFDLLMARTRFTRATTPNRLALVMVVDHLATWADENSDGWAYWPKPCRAAAKAMELIQSTTNAANDEQERNDITEAEMLAAVKPIKAFLTRQKVSPARKELILRSVEILTI